MIFDVATQISLLSDAMLLKPGDVFVTGTPSGIGSRPRSEDLHEAW